MIIKVRRGLEANRLSYTPQVGEPTFTTDTKKLYIGDGVTPGGIQVDLSGGGIVQTIVAGTNITVDNTDPANPIISAEGGGGAVESVNGQIGEVELDADDIDDSSTTHKFATASEKTKLGHIAVTQAVDLDAMETKLAGIESNADVTDAANVGAAIHGASAKTTPVDADTVALIDSAASNALKKLSWANIKATMKGYLDAFYQPLATVLTNTTASFTTALETKLNGIEAGADVTDATNVNAAGALMESELLFPNDVKNFEAADFATADQGLLADTAVQPVELGATAFSNDYNDLDNKPTIPTSVDDLSPDQTGNSGKFLTTDGANASWASIGGGGDMLASVYDPTSKNADAFSMGNMAETSTKKILSDTERTKLSGIESGADVTDAANVAAAGALMSSGLGSVTQAYDADLAAIAALSPSNDDIVQRKSGAWTNRTMAQLLTDLKSGLLDLLYPVGSIKITTSSTNPGTYLGGTWAAFGAGRVPVGYDSGQTEFDTDEETGGAKNHTLTTSEIPSHTHAVGTLATASAGSHNHGLPEGWSGGAANNPGNRIGATYTNGGSVATGSATGTGSNGAHTHTLSGDTASAGSGGAHNNLQPYIVVRMWKRTA